MAFSGLNAKFAQAASQDEISNGETALYSETIDVKGSAAVCRREDFQKMHHEYYESLGWDSNGRPKEETLRELELIKIMPDHFSK